MLLDSTRGMTHPMSNCA